MWSIAITADILFQSIYCFLYTNLKLHFRAPFKGVLNKIQFFPLCCPEPPLKVTWMFPQPLWNSPDSTLQFNHPILGPQSYVITPPFNPLWRVNPVNITFPHSSSGCLDLARPLQQPSLCHEWVHRHFAPLNTHTVYIYLAPKWKLLEYVPATSLSLSHSLAQSRPSPHCHYKCLMVQERQFFFFFTTLQNLTFPQY